MKRQVCLFAENIFIIESNNNTLDNNEDNNKEEVIE